MSEETGTKREPKKRPSVFGVGMPVTLYLDHFGYLIHCAFGEYPYLVGSALQAKAWRDVDVRLILDDDAYDAMGLGKPEATHANPRWVALCLAFAALGKSLTGLPIDFQIQQRTNANKLFDGPRSCLGIEYRLMVEADKERDDGKAAAEKMARCEEALRAILNSDDNDLGTFAQTCETVAREALEGK